jgi:hypothetical protein
VNAGDGDDDDDETNNNKHATDNSTAACEEVNPMPKRSKQNPFTSQRTSHPDPSAGDRAEA